MCKSPLVILALLTTPLLRAQLVEIYGTITEINANNVPSSALLLCPGVNCPLTLLSTVNSNQVGVGGGVTLNLLRLPVVKLGLDVRGSRNSRNNGTETVLGGLKLTIHPPALNIRPYLQGSFGYLGTTASTSSGVGAPQTTTARYAATEILAGLDLPLVRILDLRVVEIGVGHALNAVDSTKPTFVTVSAGLVLHF